jgi:hypothetical protein
MQPPYLRRPGATAYQAGPASSGFYIDLFLEHLAEGSFLYEQRIALLVDPELTWMDLEDFERRLEAHVDALLVGEELAMEVCRQQLREGDFGEAYVGFRVARFGTPSATTLRRNGRRNSRGLRPATARRRTQPRRR